MLLLVGSFQAAHSDLKKAHKRYRDSCFKRVMYCLPSAAATAAATAGTPAQTATTVTAGGLADIEDLRVLNAVVSATTASAAQSQASAETAAQASDAVVAALTSVVAGKGKLERAAIVEALKMAVTAAEKAAACKDAASAVALCASQLDSTLSVSLHDDAGSHSNAADPLLLCATGTDGLELDSGDVDVKVGMGLRASIDDNGTVGCVPSIGMGIKERGPTASHANTAPSGSRKSKKKGAEAAKLSGKSAVKTDGTASPLQKVHS